MVASLWVSTSPLVDLPAAAPKLGPPVIAPGVCDLDRFLIVAGMELVRLGDVVQSVQPIEPILLSSVREGD